MAKQRSPYNWGKWEAPSRSYDHQGICAQEENPARMRENPQDLRGNNKGRVVTDDNGRTIIKMDAKTNS